MSLHHFEQSHSQGEYISLGRVVALLERLGAHIKRGTHVDTVLKAISTLD